MSYFSLLVFTHVVLSAVFLVFILWIFAKILRISWILYFLQLWIDFLIIGCFTAFVLLYSPIQNAEWIFFFLSVIYFLIYYILGRNSIGRHLVWGKHKEYWHMAGKRGSMLLWIGFVLLSTLSSGGKSMNHSNLLQTIDDQIFISNKGSIGYDSTKTGSPDMEIHDTNGDGIFETIRYDLNKDSIVDQILVDSDQNGSINEVRILTHSSQKILLAGITLIYALLLLLSFRKAQAQSVQTPDNGGHTQSNKNNMRNKHRQEKDSEKNFATKKKKTKEKSKTSNIKNVKKTNAFAQYIATASVRIKNTTSIFCSSSANALVITIFSTSLFFQSVGGVLAQNTNNSHDLIKQYELCASDPFDTINCGKVEKQATLFFQHLSNPLFVNELRSWQTIFSPCDDKSNICNNEPYITYRKQLERWRGERSKKTALAPGTNFNSLENIPLTGAIESVDKELLSTGIAIDEKDNTGFVLNNQKVELRDNVTQILDHYERFSQMLIQQKNTDGKKNQSIAVRNFDDLIQRINSDEEHLNNLNNNILVEINSLGINKERDRYKGLTHTKLDRIKSAIQEWQGMQGLYSDEIYFALWDLWKSFEPFSDSTLKQWATDNNVDGKFIRTISALHLRGKGSSFIDNYLSYLWAFGDEQKALSLTSFATTWQWSLGANPYDIAMDLTSGIMKIIGFDYVSQQFRRMSLSYNTQVAVYDAIANRQAASDVPGIASLNTENYLSIGSTIIYYNYISLLQKARLFTQTIHKNTNEIVEGLMKTL